MFGYKKGLGNAIGYSILGGVQVEDFFKDRNGSLYYVDSRLISSNSTFTTKPNYGDTIALMKDSAGGVISDDSSRNAYQNTLSKRPIYATTPRNGRKNILNFSNKLTNSPWFKSSVAATIEIDDENSIDGRECYKLTSLPNTFGNVYIYQNVKYVEGAHKVIDSNGNPYLTLSIFVKIIKSGMLSNNFELRLYGSFDGDIS